MLKHRPLGTSGIQISALSFGAGPVAGLMTGNDQRLQLKTVQCALETGINWFDTAPTYGDGLSEINLGRALRELGAANRVHVATKIRFTEQQPGDVGTTVESSVVASLKRLGVPQVTLIQLHNSITRQRGDQPASITPHAVLRAGGVLDAFKKLKSEGLAHLFGLTGLGDDASLREAIAGGEWSTIQIPVNLLERRHYDDLIDASARARLAVLAIRVLAGGAIAGNAPSKHTLQTKFFPLDIYRRDQEQAARLGKSLPAGLGLQEASIRYVLGDAQVATALIGFAGPEQIQEAVRFAQAGPLPPALTEGLSP